MEFLSPDKLIVVLVGTLSILFVSWFFLMKKEKEVVVKDEVEVVVEGGYSPETVVIPKGKTTRLIFFRKDPTDCLSEVVLGDFKIRRKLPLNEKVTVEITPKKSGEFGYSCGMNMFHGKIIVR